MTIEEIEALQAKAFDRIEPLQDGADHATIADAYEDAFFILDKALEAALNLLAGEGQE